MSENHLQRTLTCHVFVYYAPVIHNYEETALLASEEAKLYHLEY